MEKCPFCGKPIMAGAMRCPACGKILKTPEEQQESIDRHMESQESGGGGFLKFIVIAVIAAVVAYVFFPDQTQELIDKVKGMVNK